MVFISIIEYYIVIKVFFWKSFQMGKFYGIVWSYHWFKLMFGRNQHNTVKQ